MPNRIHQFYAVAFEENFSLRHIAASFPEARVSPLNLYLPVDNDGGVYIFPFGAIVMHDIPPERREIERARISKILPKLTTKVIREDYSVLEDAAAQTGISEGMLRVDRMTAGRAEIVALTVAQSAAMEYYERIVENLFARTGQFVDLLESRGTVPFRIRPLHRFIGEAISTRTEVLSVLHLLDKPDAAWDDPAMDRIYIDLRGEFDLADRYAALISKLQSIQDSMVLLLDVARERRLFWLEVVVALLILLEIILGIVHFA
ncbi:MAG TPA: RMD1 family protein [Candidatus Binataceae bacterium]|nr:RMD1 family protein [Candidatus Binataceae bacterium]